MAIRYVRLEDCMLLPYLRFAFAATLTIFASLSSLAPALRRRCASLLFSCRLVGLPPRFFDICFCTLFNDLTVIALSVLRRHGYSRPKICQPTCKVADYSGRSKRVALRISLVALKSISSSIRSIRQPSLSSPIRKMLSLRLARSIPKSVLRPALSFRSTLPVTRLGICQSIHQEPIARPSYKAFSTSPWRFESAGPCALHVKLGPNKAN